MTLREQMQEINEKTAKIKAENPAMHSIWWEIMDADIEEMKQLETSTRKMDYCEPAGRMRFNAQTLTDNGVVLFIFSRPVKVRQHTEIIEIENAEI